MSDRFLTFLIIAAGLWTAAMFVLGAYDFLTASPLEKIAVLLAAILFLLAYRIKRQ